MLPPQPGPRSDRTAAKSAGSSTAATWSSTALPRSCTALNRAGPARSCTRGSATRRSGRDQRCAARQPQVRRPHDRSEGALRRRPRAAARPGGALGRRGHLRRRPRPGRGPRGTAAGDPGAPPRDGRQPDRPRQRPARARCRGGRRRARGRGQHLPVTPVVPPDRARRGRGRPLDHQVPRRAQRRDRRRGGVRRRRPGTARPGTTRSSWASPRTRSRPGSPPAACAPWRCGSASTRRTPRSWPAGWPRTPATPSRPASSTASAARSRSNVADAAAGRQFVTGLELVRPARSLGGTETLVLHPAGTSHRQLDEEQLNASGITGGTIRLSAGIEGVDDLWQDIAQRWNADGVAATPAATRQRGLSRRPRPATRPTTRARRVRRRWSTRSTSTCARRARRRRSARTPGSDSTRPGRRSRPVCPPGRST